MSSNIELVPLFFCVLEISLSISAIFSRIPIFYESLAWEAPRWLPINYDSEIGGIYSVQK